MRFYFILGFSRKKKRENDIMHEDEEVHYIEINPLEILMAIFAIWFAYQILHQIGAA